MTSDAGMTSPRTMISPDEALRIVALYATPLSSRPVPIAEAVGRTVAEAVVADRDQPPFPRAMMDGYAVRVASAGREVAVIGEAPAGRAVEAAVTEVGCLEIMTGAPCPPGTEAVVMEERVRRTGDRVLLPDRIDLGENVAPPGSDCRAGDGVLAAGEEITTMAVAALASFGRSTVKVVPRPRLAVIVSGAELVGAGRVPRQAQIHDSNGPMLASMALAIGLEPPPCLPAADDLESLSRCIEEVADRDIVVLSGGASGGRYDLVRRALECHGAEVIFHRVMQKPGKPLLFARKGHRLFFGLPGNPLACHLCFQRYVEAAVRGMEGIDPLPVLETGRLEESIRPKGGRTHFVPAIALLTGEGPGGWTVRPLPGASSADIFSPARANCYLAVPPGSAEIAAGELIGFLWLAEAAAGRGARQGPCRVRQEECTPLGAGRGVHVRHDGSKNEHG